MAKKQILSISTKIHIIDVSVVFTIGQFVRLQVTDIQQKIIYEDLPDVSSLIQLCDVINCKPMFKKSLEIFAQLIDSIII